MQIKILFDSMALDKRFQTGWGISYLIDGTILFDTGEKSSSLLRNMRNMGVDAPSLKTVVISHDHWDHRGGLWGILKENPKLKVYACPNFSKRFKNRVRFYSGQLIEVDKFTQVYKNLYTTGEIKGRYDGKRMPEQSLILAASKGLAILTGCAHPGIIRIVENVKRSISGNIYLVMGGFHLVGKHKETIKAIVGQFKRLGVKKIAPCHCTGKNATKLFKEAYGDNFIEVKVGEVIEI
ncbi:MAG: MBL fold metallo-hydrolase [Candidatus Omnitrophica bacterium]|nr:MBL fold metallo-hydrolase [Candidatus Omnitrophota bacterium]